MQRQFNFDRISAEQKELLSRIAEFVKDNYNLPVCQRDAFMGFGKLTTFYMFWFAISEKDELYFKSRKLFQYSLFDNIVEFPVIPQNELLIMEAINNIHQHYIYLKERDELPDRKKKDYAEGNVEDSAPNSPEGIQWRAICDRVDALLQAYYTDEALLPAFDSSLFESERAEMHRILNEIAEYFLNKSPKNSRKFQALNEYTFSDTETLATVAERFELSRERVRQLNNKAQRMVFRRLHRAKHRDDFVNQRLMAIFDIINTADNGDAQLLSLLIPADQAKRTHRFFIETIFAATRAKKLLVLEKKHQDELQKMQAKAKKMPAIEYKYIDFIAKAVFPSHPIPLSELPSSVPPTKEYGFIKAFQSRLNELPPMFTVIESPDIVYYFSSQTDHRPNFLLVNKDNVGILVIVISTAKMGINYNVTRFNQLHIFCRNHGYGYLICDERGCSIQEFKELAITPELANELDRVLNEQGYISWPDILDIKTRHTVSNRTLSAYSLQNKLYYNAMPFIIKRR